MPELLENKKYNVIQSNYKKLTISFLKKLEANQKLKLAIFDFTTEKLNRFAFTFEKLKAVKGKLKKYYGFEIYGKSLYLNDLPMFTLPKLEEIRIVISSDFSPVFVMQELVKQKQSLPTVKKRSKIKEQKIKSKSIRPSPVDSATIHNLGTRKRGGDGKMWIIVSTKKGTKRWRRISKKN